MTSGPWLDDREQRAWRAYLRLNGELLARLNRDLQADAALSLADYHVLVRLSEADDGRMRPYALADDLQWEQSRLSHHLARMQRRGLVSREECAGDGRGAWVVLTRAGRRAIESAAPKHAATVRSVMFDRLSASDVAALDRICRKVLAALDESDAVA
jgi:DNA-binding MarR family transcriptional regulator